jgi:hypothetical protein
VVKVWHTFNKLNRKQKGLGDLPSPNHYQTIVDEVLPKTLLRGVTIYEKLANE